jgi:hypothetical protein
MAENGNGKATAEWIMWVLGILVLIFIGVSSYAVTKADNALPKEDYRIDQARVESALRCLNDKMDMVLQRIPQKRAE